MRLSTVKIGNLFFLLIVLFVVYAVFSMMYAPDLSTNTRLQHDLRDVPIALEAAVALPKSLRTYLAVVILSSPGSHERRKTIRKTWLSKYSANGVAGESEKNNVRYYFAIGVRGLNSTFTKALYDEHAISSDLLLLDVDEGYSDGLITDKLVAAFVWVTANVDFTHLLKVDDDSFVRMDALLTVLQAAPTRRFYYGHFRGDATVRRAGKWADHRYFLCDRYLPYAHGGGYVLSADLVDFVVRNKDLLQRYANEDVSVGVWLSALRIERRHDRRFDTEFVSRGCSNAYLVTHKQSVDDMSDKWSRLQSNGNMCQAEVARVRSFKYDWNVPPSQCCNRTLSDFDLHEAYHS